LDAPGFSAVAQRYGRGPWLIHEKSARLFDARTFEDLVPSPNLAPRHGARRLVTGLGRITSACVSRLQRRRRCVSFPEVTQGHMAMLHEGEEMMQPQQRRVVVTGVGAVTPLGNTAEETWEAVCKGESGIGAITRFDASGFATRIAA